MPHAIVLHEVGGPEKLQWEEREPGLPGRGEVRVRHTAIGLNFIETYQRSGLYPVPLPAVLGSEAAGVVVALGEGVSSFTVGQRVAYATGPLGAYAEERNIPEVFLVPLPDVVDDRTAAASMLKGMTAHYLVEMASNLRSPVVLVHAAAGGVGLILTQWAKHRGATVIGTVGDEAKAELARSAGCDHVILYRSEPVAKRVREITRGEGADVVYDSVGKDTFEGSLDSLKLRGLLVSFGQSSGAVPPFSPLVLSTKGSLTLTRPTLHHYTAREGELAARAKALFEAIGSGVLSVRVAQTYPLREAARAHTELAARKTTGSSLLLP